MSARWIKCISINGNIRGVAIQATSLVQEIAARHGATGASAQGLSEALIGGLLIASAGKSGERVNLNIRGNGLFAQALVDAYPDGRVRGYVIDRPRDQIASEMGQLGPWGDGLLSILRTKDEENKQPYIGTVPLITGHLAKDLTFYLLQSEQIPSAVGIAAELDQDGAIFLAGGFLIQALPGATLQEIASIEEKIAKMDSLSNVLAREENPLNLLSQLFQDTAFQILEERELKFECQCSWQRVERALALVGMKEMQTLLTENNEAVIKCDFCSKEYKIAAEKLSDSINRGRQGH